MPSVFIDVAWMQRNSGHTCINRDAGVLYWGRGMKYCILPGLWMKVTGIMLC
jgi:hypothetical protein